MRLTLPQTMGSGQHWLCMVPQGSNPELEQFDPVQDRELFGLFAALLALAYGVHCLRRSSFRREGRLILGALCCLCVGLLATNLESWGAFSRSPQLYNRIEHLFFALHTVLLTFYLWRRLRTERA